MLASDRPLPPAGTPTPDGNGRPSDPLADVARRPMALVVDDERLTRRVLRRTLERLGCDVEDVVDGGEAVERVASKAFDIVFMDRMMPTMDGLAATRCIRALPEPAGSVPVVGVSGADDGDSPMSALARGMDDCLGKPFRREDVAAVLRRILGRRHGQGAGGAALAIAPTDRMADEAPEGGGEATLPQEIVETIGSFDAGPGFLEEILVAFVDTVPSCLAHLVDAVDLGDAPQAAFHAHTLKGMLANVGLADLSGRFAHIERAARVGLLVDAAQEMAIAGEALQAIATRARRWLDAQSPTSE